LGVWVAHGEGKAYFPNAVHLQEVEDKCLAPIRYTDSNNEITQKYPMNPNGSPNGIAGMCSADGRHLAMMPHPERCFLTWQWPYMPLEWKQQLHWKAAPWLKLFQNAREFCDSNSL
jgi:phosphoribosylformylglycinamidine synthase